MSPNDGAAFDTVSKRTRPVTKEVEEQDGGRCEKIISSDKDLIAEREYHVIDTISRKLHGDGDIEERAASAEVQGTVSVDDVFMEEEFRRRFREWQ